MKSHAPFQRLVPVLLLVVFGLAAKVRAQELTLLGGFTTKDNLGKFAGTWQVDYRQDFHRNFAASIAYLNEGHLPGHHRDGNAAELWLRMPLFDERMAVALGAGVDYYYDTQALPGGGSADVHGTAPIYSLSATGYFSHRVFYRVMINRVDPAHELTLTTGAVGVGFWFGPGSRPGAAAAERTPAQPDYVTENELTFFGGQSVVNTFLSPSARAWAAEYRRGLSPHLDASASFIYEGDPEIVRRSGVALQGWAVNSFFDDTVTMGFGVGPYVYIDRKHSRTSSPVNPAAIAPLVSLTFGVRFAEHWIARLNWDRVVTTYNRDSDVFLVGLGYRWGGGS